MVNGTVFKLGIRETEATSRMIKASSVEPKQCLPKLCRLFLNKRKQASVLIENIAVSSITLFLLEVKVTFSI